MDDILDPLDRYKFICACQTILKAGLDPKQVKQVNYAVNYAASGYTLVLTKDIRVQCLYILNNIQHWRGPVAKQVRADLKRIGGVK